MLTNLTDYTHTVDNNNNNMNNNFDLDLGLDYLAGNNTTMDFLNFGDGMLLFHTLIKV